MTHLRRSAFAIAAVVLALPARPAEALPSASPSASVPPAPPAPAAPPTEVALGDGVTLPLRFVVPGAFSQGDVDPKAAAPVRNVQLSRGFWLAETETTVGAFRRFVAATGYRTEAEKGATGGSGFDGTALVKGAGYTWQNPGYPITDRHPVSLITHADAKAFAAWLSTVSSSGLTFRLPTEAEWELAASREAKAATTKLAAVLAADKKRGAHPVCERRPSDGRDISFCDLLGNVSEWTEDNDRPRTTEPVVDPLETVGDRKVLKGGSWFKDPFWARPGARYSNTAGTRNADNGFRVAADVTSKPVGGTSTGKSTDLSGFPGTPSTPRSPFTFYNIVFGGMVVGILGVVFAMFVSGLRRGLSRGSVAGATLRPGVDGFFVDTDRYAPNSMCHYSCYVNGTPIRSSAPLVGKRTFVFTGGVPKNLRLERIDDPTGGFRGPSPGYDPSVDAGYQAGAIYGASQSSWDTNGRSDSWSSNDSSNSSSSSSSSFGGWPSAY